VSFLEKKIARRFYFPRKKNRFKVSQSDTRGKNLHFYFKKPAYGNAFLKKIKDKNKFLV
jgi:hypothetical protein